MPTGELSSPILLNEKMFHVNNYLFPQAFMDAYHGSIANIINRTNYMEFVNV
jgi:hypothetical protein